MKPHLEFIIMLNVFPGIHSTIIRTKFKQEEKNFDMFFQLENGNGKRYEYCVRSCGVWANVINLSKLFLINFLMSWFLSDTKWRWKRTEKFRWQKVLFRVFIIECRLLLDAVTVWGLLLARCSLLKAHK